ncbi:CYTOCHROME P450 FAMILY 76 SUBFAMILY C POLYPEPTIDE 5-RELATED [Salix purpurea]|uniref:CYTOCHROME P450 FAMILY 76 SUBFAMILY C POLYPEPTIDE 5-RELATED n=1 Tax=Salix purpurea TaxID=77065 RepID=A0A9Q0TIT4_SALPP|nr:CYTOCHROME P450 FAMILY 76 SUBFAMILY C POLYPEPTIDE 5-RELATED [Salix purpurea]
MAQTQAINLFSPVLLLLPLLLLILLKHFKHNSSPPLPPGPYPWPILGNILQLGNKPHISLTHFSKIYGPLFSLRLGTQLVVVGSSQAAAIAILKTHDRILSGRHVPHMAPSKSSELNKLSLGWVVECNEKWKYLRTVCKSELFSLKALESQARTRERKVKEMVGFINKMEGKVVKIREIATATVFNMLSNILVSRDLISLEHESEDGGMSSVLKDIARLASTPNISDFYPILGPLDLQGLRKKTMELHRRRRDFLDTLLLNGSSDDQINTLLMELLSAGTDTSSSTIEWTMAELIKNPRCLQKVQEEIAGVINMNRDTGFKESHLPQLPYLQACIKETLRLHPPGPFLLPHRAIDSCQVMNYTIPKNTQVLVNYWAIGRDPKSWEEPVVFNPERFLSSNLDFKGNDFEFIPFGSGRRICPGLPMAAKHVALIIAYLIIFFDWSLPCGKNPVDLDMSESYGLTLRKEQPLLLVPTSKK